jgi:hypothetical protein
MVNLEESIHIFGQNEAKPFTVRIPARDSVPAGSLQFEVSKGRRVEPERIDFMLDVKTAGSRVGYIPGAGDTIPDALRRMGYTSDTLTEADMTADRLANYDAIVLGIRALNTNDRIGFYMPALFQYAKNGGVVILQYNTNRGLSWFRQLPAGVPGAYKLFANLISLAHVPD